MNTTHKTGRINIPSSFYIMMRLGLLITGSTAVLGAHQRAPNTIEISSGKASVTSAEARPLQVDGADGTVDTGNWQTLIQSKAGSNVLISEGLDRDQVVAEHQEFLMSDAAKGFDQYSTQYQRPYKPSKSRTFVITVVILLLLLLVISYSIIYQMSLYNIIYVLTFFPLVSISHQLFLRSPLLC